MCVCVWVGVWSTLCFEGFGLAVVSFAKLGVRKQRLLTEWRHIRVLFLPQPAFYSIVGKGGGGVKIVPQKKKPAGSKFPTRNGRARATDAHMHRRTHTHTHTHTHTPAQFPSNLARSSWSAGVVEGDASSSPSASMYSSNASEYI